MKVDSDFRDLLRFLSAEGVQYLVIGAHAVMTYTEPRFTKDLDLWINPVLDNVVSALRALARFGAPVGSVDPEHLMDAEMIYQVGVYPVRVDIMCHVPGLAFESAWPGRTTVQLDDLSVFVIGKEDLITSKRVSGRKQDKADIRRLMRKRGN